MRVLAIGALVALLAGCTLSPTEGAVSSRGERAAPAPLPYPAEPLGPYPVGADRVTVLPGGAVAFPVARALIGRARSEVLLEMYELARPDLLDALVAARRRGVATTVVTDPTGSGSAAGAAALRAAGVDVVEYPVRRLTIDHVKLLIVDRDDAVVGGINWGSASAAHHDVDVHVTGPAVANLRRVLLADLVACGRRVAVPAAVPDSGIAVVTTLPADDVRPRVLAAVDGASQRLDLELYVLTDLGVVHAVERAHARGVVVRLLLDPQQRSSDAAAAELRAAGVQVRLYASRGELLHAKLVVADLRHVVFGSANWSAGGFVRNHEVDLDVVDSPAVAAAMERAVDADWAAASSPDSGARP